jgi:hypothetical protein
VINLIILVCELLEVFGLDHEVRPVGHGPRRQRQVDVLLHPRATRASHKVRIVGSNPATVQDLGHYTLYYSCYLKFSNAVFSEDGYS